MTTLPPNDNGATPLNPRKNIEMLNSLLFLGRCADDRLQVNAPDIAPPRVCGQLTGQHSGFISFSISFSLNRISFIISVYISLTQDGDTSLDIVKGDVAGNRQWNIKVSYLECSNPSL